MRLRQLSLAILATLFLAVQAKAMTLFEENFDSVILGPSVNERMGTIPSFALETIEVGDPEFPDFAPIPNAIAADLTADTGFTVDNNFNAFGNIDFGYNPFAQGDPTILDIDEGIVPPVGLVIGNSGLRSQGDSDDGVDEWEGWNVARKDFWVEVAGDQDRSLFTKGVGNVAIADPDEYDDLGDGRADGYYNTGLSTPSIPIPAGNSDLQLRFDSSFRAESFDDAHNAGSSLMGESLNNQTAQVWVTYDGPNGGTELLPVTKDSDAGRGVVGDPDYRPASPTLADFAMTQDETVAVVLPTIPVDATNVQLTFGLLNAGNDWWWAVDNIEVLGDVSGSFYLEDFEGVTLTDSINEQQSTVPEFAHVTAPEGEPDTAPRPNSFTATPPAGWTVDNSGMPFAVANDDIGVLEFEGWNFMDLDFWNFADTQDRELFALASGAFAVADGDEWDDLNDPTDRTDPPVGGLMDTLMVSPAIDITGVGANTLVLELDSSWRDEDDNTAVITIDYGSGPVEVLRWESDDTSPFFHDDNPNEHVTIALDNPGGATEAVLRIQYIGGNDWWWAVDNIKLSVIPEPTSLGLSMLGLFGFGVIGRRRS